MMRARAIGVLALVLALVGCSPLQSGIITAKNHKDAYTYIYYQCYVWSKYGCTLWMPVTGYVPERWWFDLQDEHEPETTGWVDVTHETFDKYEVGDYYQGES